MRPSSSSGPEVEGEKRSSGCKLQAMLHVKVHCLIELVVSKDLRMLPSDPYGLSHPVVLKIECPRRSIKRNTVRNSMWSSGEKSKISHACNIGPTPGVKNKCPQIRSISLECLEKSERP